MRQISAVVAVWEIVRICGRANGAGLSRIEQASSLSIMTASSGGGILKPLRSIRRFVRVLDADILGQTYNGLSLRPTGKLWRAPADVQAEGQL